MKQFLDSIDIDHFENYEEYLSENAIYEISKTKKNIPERFIEKYIEIVDIDSITKNQKLSQYFIEKYQDYFDFELISEHQDLSGLFIENNLEKLNIKKVCRYQKLSEEFMETHFDLLDKDLISRYQKLSDEFMKRHQYELNMLYLYMFNNSKINGRIDKKQFEKVLETLEEGEQIMWKNLCFYYPDENFIEKYIDKLSSFNILNSRKFNESFLQKHIEKFDMIDILDFQRVSEKFLRKNIDKIERNMDHASRIISFQKISFEFYMKYLSDIIDIKNYIKFQDFHVEYVSQRYFIFKDNYLCVIYQNVGHEYCKRISSNMTKEINDYLRKFDSTSCPHVKWDNISMVKLDEDVFLKYKDNLNMVYFSRFVNLDIDFIERNYKDLDIEYLFSNKNIKLPLSFIKKRMSEFTKLELSQMYLNYNGDLPLDMIEKAVLNGFGLNEKFCKLLSDEFVIQHMSKCYLFHGIFRDRKFDEEILDKHSNCPLDWKHISQYQKLSEQFIEKHSEDLYWEFVSYRQKLSETLIEKYSDKVDWSSISEYQKLSEEFIEKHSNKVKWSYISWNQKLSEPFIEKYSHNVDWVQISNHQKLSEEFIEKHSDKVYWKNITRCQVLSEPFIEKHSDKLDWENIFICQELSESFIEKHFGKPGSKNVLKCQVLSEDLLNRLIFENEINIYDVLENVRVSKEFIEYHRQDIDIEKIRKLDTSIISNFKCFGLNYV